MNALCCTSNIDKTKSFLRRLYTLQPLSPNDLREQLKHSKNVVLKESAKTRVYKTGEWVVKESNSAFLKGLLRHTFARNRYRRGWIAAHYLREKGVFTPEPLAYMEKGCLGLLWGNAMVSEYLDEARNVEDFLYALVQRGAGKDTLQNFLTHLAQAVNTLTAADAYHEDLSGKNIFTRDGVRFYFIDVDAVVIGQPYDDEIRMRNHVQLYDSFCDLLNDAMLVPFITQMLTPQHDLRVWMPQVRRTQAERRRKVEERWLKEGKAIRHMSDTPPSL